MSKEKQIEEMAKCCTYYHNGECCADATNICDCDLMCVMFGVFANLENAGYRKQSEGEWKWIADDDVICSACGKVFFSADNADAGTSLWHFCPNCGARMRKEDGNAVGQRSVEKC